MTHAPGAGSIALIIYLQYVQHPTTEIRLPPKCQDDNLLSLWWSLLLLLLLLILLLLSFSVPIGCSLVTSMQQQILLVHDSSRCISLTEWNALNTNSVQQLRNCSTTNRYICVLLYNSLCKICMSVISRGDSWYSVRALDYLPTGRAIDPAPGACIWFITNSSHSIRLSPAQYSLTVQNRGLKHQSFHFLLFPFITVWWTCLKRLIWHIDHPHLTDQCDYLGVLCAECFVI